MKERLKIKELNWSFKTSKEEYISSGVERHWYSITYDYEKDLYTAREEASNGWAGFTIGKVRTLQEAKDLVNKYHSNKILKEIRPYFKFLEIENIEE